MSKCDVCLSYRPAQTKEPLEQHQIFGQVQSSPVNKDACVIPRNRLSGLYSFLHHPERYGFSTGCSVRFIGVELILHV